MAVKDLEGLDEAARGLSSPETVEATKRALSVVAKDEMEEALYTRLLEWFAASVGEVDREELVRAASTPPGSSTSVVGAVSSLGSKRSLAVWGSRTRG